MQFKDDEEIVATFKAETREHLELIEYGILQLENHQQEIDKDLIHAMFRSAHSIKAGANLLDLKNIESLAHALETILQNLPAAKGHIESDLATVLLQGVDKISELVDNFPFSNLINISSLIDRLTEQAKR